MRSSSKEHSLLQVTPLLLMLVLTLPLAFPLPFRCLPSTSHRLPSIFPLPVHWLATRVSSPQGNKEGLTPSQLAPIVANHLGLS